MSRTRASFLLAAVLVVAAGCEERPTSVREAPGEVVGPPPAAAGPLASVLECRVDVGARTLTCAAPALGGVTVQGGQLLVGGQNVYVTLASTNVSYNAGTQVFQADVTVRNLMPQKLGTGDGTTVDSVCVFFLSLSPGSVTVKNADGTGTFTATSQPYFRYNEILARNATSAAKTWQWNLPAAVGSFTFRVAVAATVQFPDGWIDVAPATANVGVGSTVTLTPTKRSRVGADSGSAGVTWGSSDGSKATVDASGVVTGVATGTAVITASGSVAGRPVSGTATVTVGSAPLASDKTYPETVIGNVAVNSANITPTPFSVTAGDVCGGCTITAYDATTGHGGTVLLTESGADMGEFTYDPPPGYQGTDHFSYTITNTLGSSSALVSIPVSGTIWFVNAGAASNGDGRLSHPFNTLAALSAAAADDNIFLYQNATSYSGALTLLNGQKLIGQEASSNLATITGLTPGTGSTALPAMNPGSGTRTTLAGALTLASGNTLRGFRIQTSGVATALTGSSFGTLTVGEVSVAATNGRAVSLTTGTTSGSFVSVGSTSSATNGITLSGVTDFVVTGDGASDASNRTRGRITAKSGGGTLTLGSGGTVSGATGAGVSLTSSSGVVLRNVVVQNNSGQGISAGTTSGLTLDNVLVTGQADSSGLAGTVANLSILHSEIGNNATAIGGSARNVLLTNPSGAASVTASKFNTSLNVGFSVIRTSAGSTGSLTLDNVQVSGVSSGSSGIGFEARDSSAAPAYTLTVSNSAFNGNFTQVFVSHTAGSTLTYAFSTDSLGTVTTGGNTAMTLVNPTGGSASAVLTGTLDNSIVRGGSSVGVAISAQVGKVKATISNATLTSTGSPGLTFNASAGTVTNVTLSNVVASTTGGQSGVEFNGKSATICYNAPGSANTYAGDPSMGNVWFSQSATTTYLVGARVGTALSVDEIYTYFTDRAPPPDGQYFQYEILNGAKVLGAAAPDACNVP